MKGKRTILVADDNPHIRTALRVRLSACGFKVIEVGSGIGVLSEYLKTRVDAIILDHEMPEGDGRTIARFIRNECDVPIIFLTGHPREEFQSIVYELADVYFLAKPLDTQALLGLLDSLCPGSRASTFSAESTHADGHCG